MAGLEEGLWGRIKDEIEELSRKGCYESVSNALSLYIAPKLRVLAAALLGYGRRTPSRILDVGCGPGTSTIVLRALYPEAEVLALDPASFNLLAAKRRVREPSGCVQAVFESLPFPDSTFDGLVAMFSFRDVSSYLRALSEARRVLRPDGRLVILDLYRPEDPLELAASIGHFRVIGPVLGLAYGCGLDGLKFADIYHTVMRMMTPSELVREARRRFRRATFVKTPLLAGILMAEGPRPS